MLKQEEEGKFQHSCDWKDETKKRGGRHEETPIGCTTVPARCLRWVSSHPDVIGADQPAVNETGERAGTYPGHSEERLCGSERTFIAWVRRQIDDSQETKEGVRTKKNEPRLLACSASLLGVVTCNPIAVKVRP